MTNKRIRFPREGLRPHAPGPGEQFIDETDVDGHGWDQSRATDRLQPTTHGGEVTANTEDSVDVLKR